MAEWKNTILGNLMQIKGGKRLPKGVALSQTPNSHPYIRIRDLGESKILELQPDFEYVDDETQKGIARYIVHTNDVILSIVGTIGLTAIVGQSLNNANLTENCVKFVDLREIDKEYLYYFLISPIGRSEIKKGTVGAVQPKLPIKNIQSFTIKYPCIIEQQKIVSTLNAIDAKIQANNEINHNLQQQAQALFKAWFVDYEPFGWVFPNEWEASTLGSIANITSGKRPPERSSVQSAEFAIPLVGAASIMGYTNAVLYDEKILITGRVGTHGVIQRFSNKCWASDNTLVIKSPYYEYVYQFLKTVDFRSLNRGSTQPLITQSDLKKIPLILPSRNILNHFEETVGTLMARFEHNIAENDRLTALRDTLLPKLMSGEIDVSDVDI